MPCKPARKRKWRRLAAATTPCKWNFALSVRVPAGKLPDNSPLLETLRSVDRFLGNRSRLERSSTDANIPLSLGIPAVSLGGGGQGGGSHTLTSGTIPRAVNWV